MAHYLVVAHRTLVGPHLLGEVIARTEAGPCDFHLVVPVEHPTDHPWSQGEVEERARERLAEGLRRFAEIGASADGEIGDVDPVTAIATVVRSRQLAGADPFDEVLLSTLPPGPSRWLRLDVLSRARARVDFPVTHLVALRDPVSH